MKKITLFMVIIFTITLQGQNKLLSSTEEFNNGSSWEKGTGVNFEYDVNNNLIQETGLYWNSDSGNWENSRKDVYVYNANNKATEEISYVWDPLTNVYIKEYRSTHTYNGSGKIIGTVGEIWDGLQWVNDYKSEFFYNGSNLLNSYLSYSWNVSQWENDYRGTLTYNANNRVISELDEKLNGSLWENSYRSFVTYNGNNKIITYQGEEWDGFVWGKSSAENYNFDANGNRINFTETYTGSQYKTVYTYDTSALMSGFVHPFKDKTGLDYFYEDFPYVNKVLTEDQFYYDTSTSRKTYSYTNSITLGTKQTEATNEKTVAVYPNPTTSVVNLDFSNEVTFDKVVVIDVTGRVVLQQEGNTKQINVEKLVAGLYVIQAYSGNEKFTTKFVKE